MGRRVLTMLMLLACATRVAAADNTWPREIPASNGTLTLYQPQPESFAGNKLTGRAAISFVPKGKTEPVFGAFWFTAQVDTDKDAGTATVHSLQATKIRWVDSTPAKEQAALDSLTGLLGKLVVPISLERLSASLATAEKEKQSLEGLNNDPPKIVVVQELAVLLLYDGEPKTLAIPNSSLEQVINTAFAVVKDKSNDTYYLSGGKVWYSAKDPKGPWEPIAQPPPDVAKVVPPDTTKAAAPAKPPRVIVATEPTEVVATDGAPQWQPIGKGELLYIKNTETPVLREVATNQIYVLLGGRWFRSASFDGPWTFVRGDTVPASFKAIPPDSDLGGIRPSISGTEEAEDAVLDAAVPQTAAIKRSETKAQVTYDGDPKFKQIENTKVEYAVNTQSQVLRIAGKYYLCDSAVWYVSSSATGPWAVADSVPMDEIKKIPPSEPVYNVTYVNVYDSTPDVVYVGYTSGYMWSYPYYGCPIYGTGWYYPPYWGAGCYYPRPVQWGFHVGYNPYTGWNFGVSWSNGFMTVGVAFGGGYGGYYRPYYPPGGWHGCYPPGGYRGPTNINTGDINIDNSVNVGNGDRGDRGDRGNAGVSDRMDHGRGDGGAHASTRENNLYNRPENRARNADRGSGAGVTTADRTAKGPNNVYADRDGNVHRKDSSGWQERDSGQWKSSQDRAGNTASSHDRAGSSGAGSGGTATASPSTRDTNRGSSSSLDRDAQARQHGASRSSSGSSYRSSPSRSGGGMRGGGGRRR